MEDSRTPEQRFLASRHGIAQGIEELLTQITGTRPAFMLVTTFPTGERIAKGEPHIALCVGNVSQEIMEHLARGLLNDSIPKEAH